MQQYVAMSDWVRDVSDESWPVMTESEDSKYDMKQSKFDRIIFNLLSDPIKTYQTTSKMTISWSKLHRHVGTTMFLTFILKWPHISLNTPHLFITLLTKRILKVFTRCIYLTNKLYVIMASVPTFIANKQLQKIIYDYSTTILVVRE